MTANNQNNKTTLTEKYRPLLNALNESFEQPKIKPILFIDMDNVLVDFPSAIPYIPEDVKQEFEGHLDDIPSIFAKMKPMPDAIESVKMLLPFFDIYIASTAPWENPSAWSDKLNWIKKYFGEDLHKRLILTHHKNLLNGDFLIDDRLANGANEFNGFHIHFGHNEFKDWDAVVHYLLNFIHYAIYNHEYEF